MASPTLDNASARQPWRWSRALIRMWMKHARFAAVEPVAGNFRLLTLESPAFKGVHWVPGQKVQISMGSAFVARTFTPMAWDAMAGQTRILGYAHGQGPGSDWISSVNVDDECDVFGPRASLDASDIGAAPVALGDETSIGLLYALSHQHAGIQPRSLLEVHDVAETHNALARLKLDKVELFERTDNDAHLHDIEQRLVTLFTADTRFVLTGKASSIQRLRRALKDLGATGSQLMTKPYWATGKAGLD